MLYGYPHRHPAEPPAAFTRIRPVGCGCHLGGRYKHFTPAAWRPVSMGFIDATRFMQQNLNNTKKKYAFCYSLCLANMALTMRLTSKPLPLIGYPMVTHTGTRSFMIPRGRMAKLPTKSGANSLVEYPLPIPILKQRLIWTPHLTPRGALWKNKLAELKSPNRMAQLLPPVNDR